MTSFWHQMPAGYFLHFNVQFLNGVNTKLGHGTDPSDIS